MSEFSKFLFKSKMFWVVICIISVVCIIAGHEIITITSNMKDTWKNLVDSSKDCHWLKQWQPNEKDIWFHSDEYNAFENRIQELKC